MERKASALGIFEEVSDKLGLFRIEQEWWDLQCNRDARKKSDER